MIVASTNETDARRLGRPFGRLGGLRGAAEWIDGAEIGTTVGATRIRRWVALLLIGYALLLSMHTVLRGHAPGVSYALMAAVAFAVYKNMLGRFLRDWTLVLGGLFAYLLTSRFQPAFNFGAHYKPQIALDRILGFGSVPTIWLQQHFYHARTGPLEIFSTLMYASHFFVPLALGLYIWFSRRGRAFAELMFGILVMSILADVTYVLAPTAPPWLAAEHGYLPPVHHIVKDGLIAMHMNGLAAMDGDASRYNVVAALPSMHAAFPVIAFLVLLHHRLPRWIIALQGVQMVAVAFAIVYTGEHYLVDALVGGTYAVVALTLVRRGLEHMPSLKTDADPRVPEPIAVPDLVG